MFKPIPLLLLFGAIQPAYGKQCAPLLTVPQSVYEDMRKLANQIAESNQAKLKKLDDEIKNIDPEVSADAAFRLRRLREFKDWANARADGEKTIANMNAGISHLISLAAAKKIREIADRASKELSRKIDKKVFADTLYDVSEVAACNSRDNDSDANELKSVFDKLEASFEHNCAAGSSKQLVAMNEIAEVGNSPALMALRELASNGLLNVGPGQIYPGTEAYLKETFLALAEYERQTSSALLKSPQGMANGLYDAFEEDGRPTTQSQDLATQLADYDVKSWWISEGVNRRNKPYLELFSVDSSTAGQDGTFKMCVNLDRFQKEFEGVFTQWINFRKAELPTLCSRIKRCQEVIDAKLLRRGEPRFVSKSNAEPH